MLAHATVDGVAPPSYLLRTLQSALLAAATYRHPHWKPASFSGPGLSAIGSQQEKAGEKSSSSHVFFFNFRMLAHQLWYLESIDLHKSDVFNNIWYFVFFQSYFFNFGPRFKGPFRYFIDPAQGLYRYSKELQLLRHVMARVPGTPRDPRREPDAPRVCRAIEDFGAVSPNSAKRWLKVAGTQKAKARGWWVPPPKVFHEFFRLKS